MTDGYSSLAVSLIEWLHTMTDNVTTRPATKNGGTAGTLVHTTIISPSVSGVLVPCNHMVTVLALLVTVNALAYCNKYKLCWLNSEV